MQIQDATITRLVVHRVGNATRGEPLLLSGRATEIDEAVSGLLLEGYLKGIVSERRKYQFFHESDLKLNEMYQYSRECFRGELDFLAYSQRVAKHLYARSQHPNISAGDVFVIEFAGLHDGEREMRALGIFKSEIRDDFLTLTESGQEFAIGHASGINPRLIDKGALVLEYGPYAYAVDRLGQQAKFWTEDFLQAMRLPDPAATTRVVAKVVEELSGTLEDPLTQSRFKDDMLTLCQESEQLSASDFSRAAEQYLPRETVHQAFDSAVEASGYTFEAAPAVPAESMARRLERTLSRYGVGHGISVLLPHGTTLRAVESSAGTDGGLTLILQLVQRDMN
ncbi:nucleoid-associated protein [Laribacter hongkongensis]|uniref:nucleoid-associated protein n=1 Tax=Laribacter hongkongensis TaxID=168471 RepID=UPI001EFCA193|nr:nucleoid-associated protein [Laribacter hongkongensis]MCG9093574.1 nucleoid-associated protein [Laribacter hongkongensis]